MNRKSILNHPGLACQDGKGTSRPDDAMRLLAVIIARGILKKYPRHENNIAVEKDLSNLGANQ